ncbi:putative mutator mutT protein [Waddlia chondrophila 2032/99]|uniref:Nudix hydrolase domain-containing protein n=2 Tax=Waddlia chondrophila TaxID=71667 RepID=D6YW02_WADCW|nr:NUDIX domain-containing protein [Waddlia chondrophila]ADI38313.1 conserved hypothetical protein [Waddlia chondrophila WSU 86-1044]CCB91395.1 putative mutator mutT protein [Waddlia chondrophila 2032/99]
MKQSIVALVYNKEKSKVLTIKRRDVPIWVLPGGALDPGESPEDGVVREVFEETGLNVAVRKKIARYTPINKLGTTTHFFECSFESGTLQTGDETADIGFFPKQKLPKIFFQVHRDMLEDAFQEHPQALEKKFDQVTYWAFFRYFLRHPILVLRFALSQMGFPLNKKP